MADNPKPKLKVVGSPGVPVRMKPKTEYDPDGFYKSLQRGRGGKPYAQSVYPISRSPTNHQVRGQLSQYYKTERNLTPYQNFILYMKTPDIRSAIDSIVRRVATWDWAVEPTADPSSDEFAGQAKAAEELSAFLQVPNEDRQTWQEMMTQMVTDLLLYDSGVIELVGSNDADLDEPYDIKELVPWLGSEFLPLIDEQGFVVGYQQEQERLVGTGFPIEGPQAPAEDDPLLDFTPDQLCFFKLFTNSRSPIGVPIMETIINEAITLLLSSEMAMLTMDADEIPPGLLVLGGLAGAAADRAKADLQAMRGKDYKIRVISSPNPGSIDARWVELRKTPKELTMLEVVEAMRRMIWRVFGVMPVEMGSTDQMPRATAMVQMDVASSHLITPILELIQAKFNAEIIPRLIPAEFKGKIRFSFDRRKIHTPDEQLKVANRHDIYMRRGVLTINEVRSQLGLLPVKGGDVPRTDTPGYGPVPLEQLAEFIAATTGTLSAKPVSGENDEKENGETVDGGEEPEVGEESRED